MGGSHPFPIEKEKGAPHVGVLPIAEYSHVDQGICVIGIGVYRGQDYPGLDGVYFARPIGEAARFWGLKQDNYGKWPDAGVARTSTRRCARRAAGRMNAAISISPHAHGKFTADRSIHPRARRGALWKNRSRGQSARRRGERHRLQASR